jgi:hypothetical protein
MSETEVHQTDDHSVSGFARDVAGFITGWRLFLEEPIQFGAGLAD